MIGAAAQFGSIQVDWSAGGVAHRSSAHASPRARPGPSVVVAGEARRGNLFELAASQPKMLRTIVESFGIGGCDACESDGHWVAKVQGRAKRYFGNRCSADRSYPYTQVRQGVLELPTKRLRAQLQKRGIRCGRCPFIVRRTETAATQ